MTPEVVAVTADVEVASADEGLDRLPLPLLADAWDVTVTVTPFGPTCPTLPLFPQDLAHPGTHIFIMFFALGTSGRGIQLLSNPLPDDVFGSRIQMVPMLFALELGVVLHKINQHQLIVLFPVVIGDIFLRCPNPFLLHDTFCFTRWMCLGVL